MAAVDADAHLCCHPLKNEVKIRRNPYFSMMISVYYYCSIYGPTRTALNDYRKLARVIPLAPAPRLKINHLVTIIYVSLYVGMYRKMFFIQKYYIYELSSDELLGGDYTYTINKKYFSFYVFLLAYAYIL